jgi:hypothetical protein
MKGRLSTRYPDIGVVAMLVDMAVGAIRAQSGLLDLSNLSYTILFKRSGLNERRDKASRYVLSRLRSAAIGSGPL